MSTIRASCAWHCHKRRAPLCAGFWEPSSYRRRRSIHSLRHDYRRILKDKGSAAAESNSHRRRSHRCGFVGFGFVRSPKQPKSAQPRCLLSYRPSRHRCSRHSSCKAMHRMCPVAPQRLSAWDRPFGGPAIMHTGSRHQSQRPRGRPCYPVVSVPTFWLRFIFPTLGDAIGMTNDGSPGSAHC